MCMGKNARPFPNGAVGTMQTLGSFVGVLSEPHWVSFTVPSFTLGSTWKYGSSLSVTTQTGKKGASEDHQSVGCLGGSLAYLKGRIDR